MKKTKQNAGFILGLQEWVKAQNIGTIKTAPTFFFCHPAYASTIQITLTQTIPALLKSTLLFFATLTADFEVN